LNRVARMQCAKPTRRIGFVTKATSAVGPEVPMTVLVQNFRAVEPLPVCVVSVRPKARRPRERARPGPRCADDPG
jgi:hypothetical protein